MAVAVQRRMEPLRVPTGRSGNCAVMLCACWLLLLCTLVHAQGDSVQFLIDTADCEVLVSWNAFAAIPDAPKSCKQTACNAMPGATCDYQTGRLTRLDASSRRLTGGLPASWGALTALTELNLRDNSLTGTVPPSWDQMTAITRLDLSGNKLTGALPTGWQKAKFTQLELTGTQLVDGPATGALPPTTAQTGNTTAAARLDCGPGTAPSACKEPVKRNHIMSAAVIAGVAAAGGIAVALLCAAIALWRWCARRKARQAKQAHLPFYQVKSTGEWHMDLKNTAAAPHPTYVMTAGPSATQPPKWP